MINFGRYGGLDKEAGPVLVSRISLSAFHTYFPLVVLLVRVITHTCLENIENIWKVCGIGPKDLSLARITTLASLLFCYTSSSFS